MCTGFLRLTDISLISIFPLAFGVFLDELGMDLGRYLRLMGILGLAMAVFLRNDFELVLALQSDDFSYGIL